MANEKQRPDAALQMLKLAAEVFPDNPLIRLKIAQLSSELGDRKISLHLVEQLQKLSWSPVYYPQMPGYLNGFAEFLQKEPPPGAPTPLVLPKQSQNSKPGDGHAPRPTGHP